MSASAVYVLDLKGKVLVCRNYRGDVDMSEIEHFMTLLMDKEEEGTLSPILAHGGVRFMWIKHNNLYLVATSKKNASVSLVFSFLYKIVQVFSEYFKELEEESIRDNFVIIYELMDELMDFGYPQTTDSKILQEYITQEGHKLDTGAPRPPATVTNAVSWRSEGIKYRKNEVFLDVIESVNLLVSANGNVLRSEIVGSIKMRVFLSGMPELRLGLNDKVLFENTGRGKSKSVELEDVKFHQCVRLSRFENDRTISFIPPDGEFELMSYRLNTHVKPLIWIESVIEKHSHSRIEYMIKAKSQFKRRSTANNVEIHIPVPTDADSPKFKTTVGSVKWVPENSEIVWSIKSFPGGKEYLMRAHFGLPSVEAEDKEGKPPISVKFEIPYFTTSGIQVRYLKIIEKSGYQALPWVRYITQNGDYQLRTHPSVEAGARATFPLVKRRQTSPFPSSDCLVAIPTLKCLSLILRQIWWLLLAMENNYGYFNSSHEATGCGVTLRQHALRRSRTMWKRGGAVCAMTNLQSLQSRMNNDFLSQRQVETIQAHRSHRKTTRQRLLCEHKPLRKQ
ncbi:AP-1 complex subunit mu-1 [Solea senegalensis]|nr:AP-1 complex subunit mu-1 [Solea senegalensis]